MRQFGRYLIHNENDDLIGQGGFGRVYRAYDPNLKKNVAIKVLSTVSDPDLLKRFTDECRTTARLEHENIVKVYDFDQQDGMPYLVMQLLPGQTLDGLTGRDATLGGKRLELLSRVEILLQVAKGLAYAHSLNVIHRDVKPANVMVTPDGKAKIMDFGIARVVDKDGTRRTRQGDIAGTILYMAPEQFRNHDADRSSDIFAFGGLCYEFLTGRHPFSGNDVGTVIYNITAVDPVPIRQNLPECPEELELIIQRLMIKDPELRPARLEEAIMYIQPVVQRLRQQEATAAAASLEGLMASGDREAVRTAIESVLELDPVNAVARKFWDELRSRERQDRVAALLQQGRQYLAERKTSDAERCFEKAAALDKNHPEARALLEQARSMGERIRKATRLLAEARAEHQAGHLQRASELALNAAAADPEDPVVAQFVQELRKLLRLRREEDTMALIGNLAAQGRYDEALAALTQLEAESTHRERLAPTRLRLENDRAEALRRERHRIFEDELRKARAALYEQRLQNAEQVAQRLSVDYAEEPSSHEFLLEVREYLAAQRRVEAVAQITRQARELIAERRCTDAVELLTRGNQNFPGDTKIQRLLDMAEALSRAQKRAGSIADAASRAGALCDEGRLEAAAEVVGQAIAEFGNEPPLRDARKRVEAALQQRARAAALQKTLQEARSLLPHRPADAVDRLLAAEAAHGRTPELTELLAAARQVLATAQEREAVTAARSRIQILETAGQLGAACDALQESLDRFPKNPDLLAIAGPLREKLRQAERARRLAEQVRSIEQALASRDLDLAMADWHAAAKTFPDAPVLRSLSERIREKEREAEVERLRHRIRACFAGEDLKGAEVQLTSAGVALGDEPVWKALRKELDLRQSYQAGLMAAGQAVRLGQFDAAEQALLPLLADAPDDRANNLLASVRQALAAAQEREAVAAALTRIQALETAGEFAAACDALQDSLDRFPNNPDLPAIAGPLREKLRQAERARRLAEHIQKVEQALAAGDLGLAGASWQMVAENFPDDPVLQSLSERIEQLRRKTEIADLQNGVRACFARDDLDGAEARLAAARLKFGEEPGWKALWGEFEHKQRYQAGLTVAQQAHTLGEFEAAEQALLPLLEDAPDDRAANLLASVRQALAAAREREAVTEALSQIRTLETAGQFAAACDALQESLERIPNNSGLLAIAEPLREKLRQAERASRLAEHIRRIEDALASSDLELATANWRTAAQIFPDEPGLQSLFGRIEERKRNIEIADLQNRVRACFAGDDLKDAEAQLAAARLKFGEEPGWKTLWGEFEHKQRYQIGLILAQQAHTLGEFEAAEQALLPLLADAPDDRAANLLASVRQAVATAQEHEAAAEALSRIQGLEAAGQLAAACDALQESLERFPNDSDLLAIAEPLREKLRQAERAKRRAEHIRNIEQALASGDLGLAQTNWQTAVETFPDDPVLHSLSERIQHEERKAEIESLKSRIQACLAGDDLKDAEAQLAAAHMKFGAEPIWKALRKELDLRRSYEAGLAAGEQSIRLGQLDAAEQALRPLLADAPDNRAANLLASVRQAVAAAQEHEAAAEALSRIQGLEAAGQLAAACDALQESLERFPNDSDLLASAEPLREKLRQAERAKRRAEHIRNIEQALASGDLGLAQTNWQTAVETFPDDPGLRSLSERIQHEERKAEIESLKSRIQACLAGDDLKDAEAQLAAAHMKFGAEPIWKALRKELDLRQSYEAGLAAGEQSIRLGKLDAAEQALRPLLADAPDNRAANLLASVSEQRAEAARRARREADDRARRQDQAAIELVRREVAGLVIQGDYQAAIQLLDQAAAKYPNDPRVREDREAVAREWKRRTATPRTSGEPNSDRQWVASEDRAKRALEQFSKRKQGKETAAPAERSAAESSGQRATNGDSQDFGAPTPAETHSVPPPAPFDLSQHRQSAENRAREALSRVATKGPDPRTTAPGLRMPDAIQPAEKVLRAWIAKARMLLGRHDRGI